MGERLRPRDARNNSNKCYAVFFDDGDDESSKGGNSFKATKIKSSRSPSKKRESPKRRTRKIPATTSVDNCSELVGMLSSEYLVGGEFVANVTTKMVTPLNDVQDRVAEEVTKARESAECGGLSGGLVDVSVCWKSNATGGAIELNALDRVYNKNEHVVVSDDNDDGNDNNDDEENMKSESLKSNNNNKRKLFVSAGFDSHQTGKNVGIENEDELEVKKMKLDSVKDQMFEIFQPWALKTYGDQAKTKTITRRKKNRILKALDGKEQNNPDSSKFRFWVKSKGFTIQKPENFSDNLTIGAINGRGISTAGTLSTAQEMDTQKDHIDLYVASTVKDFGERTYRKVAVVEDFFNIIYSVHVEQGGRSGRHAGQKRTYRIITESYAFLPREAVTKFLTSCPICKRNLRPFSPSRFDDTFNESSSEYEALNFSSPNESSVDSIQFGPIRSVRLKAEGKASPLVMNNSFNENKNLTTIVTKCDRKLTGNRETVSYFDNTSKLSGKSKYFDNGKLGGRFEERSSLIREPGFYQGFKFADVFNFTELSNCEQLYQNQLLFLEQCKGSQDLSLGNMSYDSSRRYDRTDCVPVSNCYRFPDKFNIPQNKIIPSIVSNKDSLESTIDLTINQANSVNINIGNSNDVDRSSPAASIKTYKSDTMDDVYVNTVDVSINMSNTSNELKILCKTSPPKKRYSIFKDMESTATVHHSSSTSPRPDASIVVVYDDDDVDDDVGNVAMQGDGNCAINLSKKFRNEFVDTRITSTTGATTPPITLSTSQPTGEAFRVDLSKVKPITSTYLRMTRSFGLSDEDALRIDDLEPLPTPTADPVLPDTNPEEAYAGLMKDADKLKLMLLAWNYQNSNAIRNGSEAPDLGVVGGLWAQYQNALALNAKQPSISPVNRTDQPSPIENQDETNSSGQKDDDDVSEDDSDDKLDQNAHDPERLKAFNMFVRLFVDENLDRMVPISKQPKEKIQAIIDSCARQFPEFCERSRKRIRTYLKSCRRNKKAREGWDNASRPTPAHLTSVQAEQILAIACENESLNAKRMRIGLDPISQSLPLASSSTVTTDVVAPSITYPGFRATPSTTTVSTTEHDSAQPSTTTQNIPSARSSPIGLTTNQPVTVDSKVTTPIVNGIVTGQIASPLFRPTEFTSPSSTSSPYTAASTARPSTTYPTFFPASTSANVTPTDLSMKQHIPATTQQPTQSLPTLSTSSNAGSSVGTPGRPPLLSHKLNPNEISAVRQLVTGYRESAAFLLRSADELEQLLLQQQ